MSQEKHCNKCGRAKPVGQFGRWSRGRDGLQPWCKKCKAAACRERKERIASENRRTGYVAKRKVCGDCGVKRDSGAFYRNARDISGLSHYCKGCYLRRRRDKYTSDPVRRMKQVMRSRTYRMVDKGEISLPATCDHCGVGFSDDAPREIHHISYDVPDNILALCGPCHTGEHREH